MNTHLCGSIYETYPSCEHLKYVQDDVTTFGKRKLKKYYVYCMAEGRCRSLGCVASFTGNSPMWCPKRKELENDKSVNSKTSGVGV